MNIFNFKYAIKLADVVNLLKKVILIKERFNQVAMLILLFIICFSCDNDGSDNGIILGDEIIQFSEFPKEDSIYFTNLYEFKKGVPGMLHLMDSTLIIFNNGSKANEFFFYNYSLKNNKLSKGYLARGRGPGEVLGAVCSGMQDDKLWVYDITLKKIITLSRTTRTDSTFISNEYPIKEFYYMIDFKDSTSLYGVGSFHSKFKVQEISLKSNRETNEFGSFKYIPDDIPFYACKTAYESFIYSKPNGGKIVLAYRFTDAIEIFNLEKQTSKVIHGPEGFDVDFKPLNIGDKNYVMGTTERTKRTFVNGAVTDKYIYLAYSGSLFNSINSYFANYIYVYDWNGNPIKKMVLNREIISFTVSKNDNKIYAFDANSGFIIQTNIN